MTICKLKNFVWAGKLLRTFQHATALAQFRKPMSSSWSEEDDSELEHQGLRFTFLEAATDSFGLLGQQHTNSKAMGSC